MTLDQATWITFPRVSSFSYYLQINMSAMMLTSNMLLHLQKDTNCVTNTLYPVSIWFWYKKISSDFFYINMSNYTREYKPYKCRSAYTAISSYSSLSNLILKCSYLSHKVINTCTPKDSSFFPIKLLIMHSRGSLIRIYNLPLHWILCWQSHLIHFDKE